MLNIVINDFEGPLDLLLYLVESKKMNIREISISKIIDDYIEIINNQGEDKFKLKVEFLQMASLLLEIKAFSILRADIKNKKEEDLEKRLMEYKIFKELSEEFSKSENEYFRTYRKKGNKDFASEIIEHDNSILSIESLQNAINNIFSRLDMPNRNAIKLELEEEFSVEDALEEIDFFGVNEKISFSSLLKGKYSRARIVSFFMAILESYKENKIDILLDNDEFYIIKEKNSNV
ncbi:segregation and condensation protein A [Oceanivirga salmonicida]|uniref:segregation and condensation protein A n=1 Tax=Oceanivirga salmonicida TaxID=1769291 RepID=UPI000831D66F|nr:ScpA family protein [Oceanivirga salmonicida]